MNAVYIPPEVDVLTDEENIDDNEMLHEIPLDREIAGTFEIDVGNDDDLYDESDEESLAEKKRRMLPMRVQKSKEPKWGKKELTHIRLPESNENEALKNLRDSLEGKTPLEMFFLFFDEEIMFMIVNFSVKYALDSNRSDFDFTVNDLKKFLGILILSGYHILPQADL